jgi:hypothetical protein
MVDFTLHPGSAIYLFGTANASYDVILDDATESFPSANGLMYSKEALIDENHSGARAIIILLRWANFASDSQSRFKSIKCNPGVGL